MSILPGSSAAVASASSERKATDVPLPFAQEINDAHPLESRIANWRSNEEQFRLQLLQRTQGAAEPIRRTMETQILEKSTFVPMIMGGPSNVHLDILRNHDASVDWEDVHRDTASASFHEELAKRMAL